jgi:bacterioferritin
MKGDPKVLELLNEVLKNELTAINQYFLHSRMLKDWGIIKFADYEYKESIEEMQHADKVIERILFLDGLPNLQALHPLRIGENVEEIIEGDLALEHQAVPALKEGVTHAENVKDFVSRDLFAGILLNEEEHIDHLETFQSQIKQMGIANFIQLQSDPA